MLVCAVVATGLVGWGRSAPLRTGSAVPATAGASRARSSPTTWLAAAAGACGLVVAAAADWAVSVRAAGAAAAGLVLVTGLAARVTSISTPPPGAVVVSRAALPDLVVRAEQLAEVIPPRWPLGAWRIVGAGTRISLMPSDLLGSERALERLIVDAGLRFDGSRWRRPA